LTLKTAATPEDMTEGSNPLILSLRWIAECPKVTTVKDIVVLIE
jgi:hypothetical protein